MSKLTDMSKALPGWSLWELTLSPSDAEESPSLEVVRCLAPKREVGPARAWAIVEIDAALLDEDCDTTGEELAELVKRGAE